MKAVNPSAEWWYEIISTKLELIWTSGCKKKKKRLFLMTVIIYFCIEILIYFITYTRGFMLIC